MSRYISIDIKLTSNERTSIRAILKTLVESGWNPMIDGLINYLPINDNEMYNWTKEKISVDQLYEIVESKEQKQETIGVDMCWEDSNVGISLLAYNPNEISLGLDVNRKYIDDSTHLIDFNWYATRILLALCKSYHVSQYKFGFVY